MTLVEQFAAVRRALHRRLTRRLAQSGERPFPQLLALRVIAYEGIPTQSALAERLLIDPPATSRLVDRLEDDGLIRRCKGENRRCVRLELTPAGRAEVHVIDRELAWLDEQMRAHLTAAEAKTFARLLAKLRQGLYEDADPGPDASVRRVPLAPRARGARRG